MVQSPDSTFDSAYDPSDYGELLRSGEIPVEDGDIPEADKLVELLMPDELTSEMQESLDFLDR